MGNKGMATGSTHSLFIKVDGSLWATGNNLSGQLCDGNSGGDYWDFEVGVDRNSPILVVESGVKAVSAGEEHSLVLMENGSLWAAGGNQYGQLGDGTTDDSPNLSRIVASGVVACSAGLQHSLYVLSDGSLWGMGLNEWGALGDGSEEGQNLWQMDPVKVVDSGVTACSAGKEHSLFTKSDGSLWAMGANNFGQLGDGTGIDQYSPVKIRDSGVKAIAAGGSHSLFVMSDGSLWAMGDNFAGQLGDGTQEDRLLPVQIVPFGVMDVAAGELYSVYVLSDGSVWSMGWAHLGRLGNGASFGNELSPVQVIDGGITKVSAGQDHWFALGADHTLLGIGLNYHGQLGAGVSGGSASQFSVGIDYSEPTLVSGVQYSLSGSVGDDDAQFFTLSGNRLFLSAPVNFLGRSSYTVQVLALTEDGQYIDEFLALDVDLENLSDTNPGAVPLGSSGWVFQDWFGLYYSGSPSWIYHGATGWLYLDKDPAGEGYWVWSLGLGWLWVAPAYYPWTYLDGQGWVYFPWIPSARVYYDPGVPGWVGWE